MINRTSRRRLGRPCFIAVVICCCLTVVSGRQSLAGPADTELTLQGRLQVPPFFDSGAILVQEFTINQLGLRARGEVSIQSMTPFAGEVRLAEASGNPRKILALLSGWVDLPEGIAEQVLVQDIVVKELVLGFGAPDLNLRAASVSFDGGLLENISAQSAEDGSRTLTVERLHADRMPVRIEGLPIVHDLGVEQARIVTHDMRIELTAGSLTAEGSEVKELYLEMDSPNADPANKGESFTVRAATATLDVERLWNLALHWPTMMASLRKTMAEAGVDAVGLRLAGHGRLQDIAFAGALPSRKEGEQKKDFPAFSVSGAADLALMDMRVSLAEKGNGSSPLSLLFTVPKMAARLTLGDVSQTGKISLDALHLKAGDGVGGEIAADGRVDWPIDLERLSLDIVLKEFRRKNWQVTGRLGWRHGEAIPMKLQVSGPEFVFDMGGRVQSWTDNDLLGMDIICPEAQVDIKRSADATETGEEIAGKTDRAEPFFKGRPPVSPFPLRMQVDRIEITDMPAIGRFLLAVMPASEGKTPQRLSWSADWCQAGLGGDVTASEDGVVTALIEGRVTDVAAANLIACGLALSGAESPPVYLDGKTYARFQAETRGRSLADLEGNLAGKVTVAIEDGRIMRLSNVRGSARFFLDVLRMLRLNPTKLRDTLVFDQLLVRGSADFTKKKEVDLQSISLVSPLLDLHLGGRGKINFEESPPVLELDAEGRAKGFTKKIQDSWVLGDGS